MRLSLLLICAAHVWAQSPDPNEIVRRSIDTMGVNEPRVQQYTWHRERIFFRLDKKGNKTRHTTLTLDAMRKPGKCEGYCTEEIISARNGKPITNPKPKDGFLDWGLKGDIGISFNIGMIPGLFDVSYLREDVFRGRKCWVILATPSPRAKPKNQSERNILNHRMTIWITQEGFHDGRYLTEVIGDQYPMGKGSTMEWIEEPNEEGVWLAHEMHWLYTAAKGGARGEIHDTFTNYRKFEVDSRITVDPQ